MSNSVEDHLYECLLPGGLLRKGIIRDASGSLIPGYEEWLAELINASRAFMTKTLGKPFKRPNSESHGEDDVCTNAYSLDFKLVAGRSMMHATREMAAQKLVYGGAIFTLASRRDGKMRALVLHKVLRGFTQVALRRIWDATEEDSLSNDAEKEVFWFFKTLKKDKNLLLLYPSLLYIDDAGTFPMDEACSMVYADFAGSIALRREFYENYENYIAFFADGKLVVLQVDENGWKLFDTVPTSASPALVELLRYYDVFDYQQLEALIGRG